jgi:hypothetical protein
MFQSRLRDPVVGRATIIVHSPAHDIFEYIGVNFFANYPKWSPEVVELEQLSGGPLQLGTQARQVRVDQRRRLESRFEVTEYEAGRRLRFAGVPDPFVCTYELEPTDAPDRTSLTFTFEGFELRGYMKPFEKLIRVVVQDGAERTVRNIRRLVERQRRVRSPVSAVLPRMTGGGR